MMTVPKTSSGPTPVRPNICLPPQLRRARDRFDDDVRTRDPRDLHRRSRRHVDVGCRGEVVRRSRIADEDAPVAARRNGDVDPPGLPDEVEEAEGLGTFGPAQDAEHAEDEAEPERARDAPEERCGARVQLEDLRSDEPTDPEHRHEPEKWRHERDTADVHADVQRVEHPADDVVEHDGEQQEAAADGEAKDEDSIREIELEQSGSPPAGRFYGGAEDFTRSG